MFLPVWGASFMAEADLLSPIFLELITKAEKIPTITPKVVEEFCALIGGDTDFTPELVNIIGPATFLYLVQFFGGQKFTIPEIDDILERVKFARSQDAEL